ncbi:hypothetical protein Y1Q_0003289 [Alligator mississippiensis]|uniref:Uncharacterized protein n=1 Tax=Alligator mississippiensis TaxID=8496 RepID=A0A151ME85_ALLMI|nr:hypothetical protein Y1Q_0003289 [Alligator mississippiensis]
MAQVFPKDNQWQHKSQEDYKLGAVGDRSEPSLTIKPVPDSPRHLNLYKGNTNRVKGAELSCCVTSTTKWRRNCISKKHASLLTMMMSE